MPTITGRSNTGLLGAIFTTGRVAEAMISPYGADADRILRPSLAAQPVPMSASAPSSAKLAAATRCIVFAGTRLRRRSAAVHRRDVGEHHAEGVTVYVAPSERDFPG